MREFNNDVLSGLNEEDSFLAWLYLCGHEVVSVTHLPNWQKQGIDFVVKKKGQISGEQKDLLTVDVKRGHPDLISIEESSTYPDLNGWFYTSQAKTICFVCLANGTLSFLSMRPGFKRWYQSIKEGYKLRMNEVSTKDGRTWQSAFRVLPKSILGKFLVIKQINGAT